MLALDLPLVIPSADIMSGLLLFLSEISREVAVAKVTGNPQSGP